jgi:2'-5' RNA ligase
MSGPGRVSSQNRGRDAAAPADHPRLFVAVPVPPPIATRIGAIVDLVRRELGPDGDRVRWVQMEGLHLTLRFLGPTRPDHVQAAESALEAGAHAAGGSFEVRIDGAGSFPDGGRPRALWLGITSGARELGQLAAAVTGALSERGWAIEERAFRPHLTIARTDGVHAGADAGRLLAAAASGLDLAFMAQRVVLYRSHLGRGPARYEELRAVDLG